VVGGQYDDDLNQLWLPYYSLVDINFSRKIFRNVEAFFGVQNLLNREFYVQRNPTTVGGPRLVTGGSSTPGTAGEVLPRRTDI
jgi:outer membrane receptor protein involved in Fe transport